MIDQNFDIDSYQNPGNHGQYYNQNHTNQHTNNYHKRTQYQPKHSQNFNNQYYQNKHKIHNQNYDNVQISRQNHHQDSRNLTPTYPAGNLIQQDSNQHTESEELPVKDAAEKVGPPLGPSFDYNLPRNITVQAGKTAILSCRVFNLNDKSVSWIRQDSLHILTVNKYTYSTDQRVSVVFNEPNLEWVLRIRGVSPEDAGVYECQVSTKPVLSYIVTLGVVVPKAMVLNSPEMHVHRGSPINLTCVVTHGTERPVYIYWYHHKKVVDYEGRGGVKVETVTGKNTVSHLLVEKAGPRDAGKYTCAPYNGIEASINLHVLRGEYQAAMQTNGSTHGGTGRTEDRTHGIIISSILFSLIIPLFSSPPSSFLLLS